MVRKRISPDEEIEAIKKEREQLKNRLARAKARKLDELQGELRKAENRLKMLTGIAVLQAVKAGELDQELLDQWLDRYIVAGGDKAFITDQRTKSTATGAEGESEDEQPKPAPEPAEPDQMQEPDDPLGWPM